MPHASGLVHDRNAMLYLQQDFDLAPASPRTRDAFIELASEALVPAAERHGARLVAAFFSNREWFFRVTQFLELPTLAAYEDWRHALVADAAAIDAAERVAALAPARSERLLEPLGAIPVEVLHQAIEASAEQPSGVFSAATLEVARGRMSEFTKLLTAAGPQLPIVASWRPLAGNPDLVIDLWKGDVETGYAPADARSNAFFDPLREVAPREHLMRYWPLPYSPLR
jgi:hypothetical protein